MFVTELHVENSCFNLNSEFYHFVLSPFIPVVLSLSLSLAWKI